MKKIKHINLLKHLSHENFNLPNNIVGTYHSGNGKRPNTRQPNSKKSELIL